MTQTQTTPLALSTHLPPTVQVYFDLVDATDAMDPIGPPEGAPVPGAPAGTDPADALAMRYYCALNFNVGGSIKRNTTVERVAEDGPLSPGAYQCARECNRMGAACAAFGVVAGTNCYLMGSVRGLGDGGVAWERDAKGLAERGGPAGGNGGSEGSQWRRMRRADGLRRGRRAAWRGGRGTASQGITFANRAAACAAPCPAPPPSQCGRQPLAMRPLSTPPSPRAAGQRFCWRRRLHGDGHLHEEPAGLDGARRGARRCAPPNTPSPA